VLRFENHRGASRVDIYPAQGFSEVRCFCAAEQTRRTQVPAARATYACATLYLCGDFALFFCLDLKGGFEVVDAGNTQQKTALERRFLLASAKVLRP
jgi:hypothetical protein